MRRQIKLFGIGLAGALLLSGSLSTANAEEEGRLYYNDGTRLEFGEEFDMKFNILLQPRYTYEDRSQKDRAAIGIDPGEDSSSFTLNTGRLVLSGNALEKQFSFKLENDFGAEDGTGQMLDAWAQWNGEIAKIRFGQTKVPFGRQERVHRAQLFFVDRGMVNEIYNLDRDTGVVALGALGDEVNWYTGLFNGSSTGEGPGRAGVDPTLNWAAAADWSSENYGGRGLEGDFREDGDLAFTLGGSVLYGEGTLEGDLVWSDADQTAINIDAGLRVCGFDLQGEVFWREYSVDFIVDNGIGDIDSNGFYLQAAYNMDKLGMGYRFGFYNPDSKVAGDLIDDVMEHSVVLNYYINGHFLKLQNGFTWELHEVVTDGDDINDFRYQVQLAGLF